MKNIRNLFLTPKKAIISVICILAILCTLGVGSVFAASSIAESSSIGADKAKNFAFADAGVDPASATGSHAEFTFEQGHFVYEVEFTADNTEYEYLVKASDGSIMKKEMELLTTDGHRTSITASITIDEAKQAALADAGVDSSQATFTEAKLEQDDGRTVYEIDFYTENEAYEYEIIADTGAVFSKSKETFVKNTDNSGQQQSNDTASSSKQDDASASSSKQDNASASSSKQDDASASSSKQDNASSSSKQDNASSSSKQDNASSNNANKSQQNNSSKADTSQSQQGSSDRISLEAAKKKALSNAGVSASDATFTKEKTDTEDGIPVYEIEFYTSSHEYEYEINAQTGAIMKKESEARKRSSSGSSGSSSDPSGTSNYIGVDKAKSIALRHAGLSASDVTFKKAKLDKDDGRKVYEIEFRKDGWEYEYTIDAATGDILEHDIDD